MFECADVYFCIRLIFNLNSLDRLLNKKKLEVQKKIQKRVELTYYNIVRIIIIFHGYYVR